MEENQVFFTEYQALYWASKSPKIPPHNEITASQGKAKQAVTAEKWPLGEMQQETRERRKAEKFLLSLSG